MAACWLKLRPSARRCPAHRRGNPRHPSRLRAPRARETHPGSYAPPRCSETSGVPTSAQCLSSPSKDSELAVGAQRASASPTPCTFRIRAARCRSRNPHRASRSVAVANSGAVMPADATRSRSALSPLSPGQGRASRLSPGVAEAAWPRRPGTLSVLDLQRVCQAGYGRVPGGGDGASPAGFSSGRSRWPRAGACSRWAARPKTR